MAHDVFISHSTKDKTTADAVCAMLESNGVRCWIAPRDVTPGMEWSECIIDAIKECRIMILIFSAHANQSSQIRKEVERAVNHGVVILPLRVEDVIPGSALEYFIGNVHWLDALTPPLETHLRSLADTVKILLLRLKSRDVLEPAAPIQPAAAASMKPAGAESEPSPQANPSPPESPPTWPPVAEAASASWQIGDTLMDAAVPKSRREGQDTTTLGSPAKEAAFQAPSPSHQKPPPQLPFDVPSTAGTEAYRGTSTLGDISTISSDARTPAAPVKSTSSRWGSRTSLILIASAVVAAVVVLSVIYISHGKAPESTTSLAQDQSSQPLVPPATQSSQPTAAGSTAQAESVAPTQTPADQEPVQESPKSPAQRNQDACDGGDAAACASLGIMYLDGKVVPNDDARAAQLFQKACDASGVTGCTNLAYMYMYGNSQGMRKDDNRAARLFQKACDGGDAVGCSGLGFMYMSGQGVKIDHTRAAQFYQKACDLGNAPACGTALSQKSLIHN